LKVGLYGQGLYMPLISAHNGVATVDVAALAEDGSSWGPKFDVRPITSIRVLFLAKGYAVGTFVGPADSAGEVDTRLYKLPLITVRGRLDPPPPFPIKLSFSYDLVEAMGYFGYTDGSTPVLELGTATPDAAGVFKIDLPDVTADPFIDQERQVDVQLIAPEHLELGSSLPDVHIPLRQLYSGSRLAIRPDGGWPPNPSLQRTTPGRSPGCCR
jgi:hypothetical protein